MTDTPADPIRLCIDKWLLHLAGELEGGYDALLDDDVIFHSPVVFTPQVGKAITAVYLGAAEKTLVADGTGFTYTKKVLDGHHAVLEFETTMDGKVVNGVDVITCDDESMVTEFRVMIRPLQGVQVVHAQMKAMLESMQGN